MPSNRLKLFTYFDKSLVIGWVFHLGTTKDQGKFCSLCRQRIRMMHVWRSRPVDGGARAWHDAKRGARIGSRCRRPGEAALGTPILVDSVMRHDAASILDHSGRHPGPFAGRRCRVLAARGGATTDWPAGSGDGAAVRGMGGRARPALQRRLASSGDIDRPEPDAAPYRAGYAGVGALCLRFGDPIGATV